MKVQTEAQAAERALEREKLREMKKKKREKEKLPPSVINNNNNSNIKDEDMDVNQIADSKKVWL